MRRALVVLALCVSAQACSLLADLEPDPVNCEVRQPFWPDADGDGVGDEGTIYVGCDAPEGYVDVPPVPADTDVRDTDMVDTDVADTDVGDTDLGDTDDTDPSDTDALVAR